MEFTQGQSQILDICKTKIITAIPDISAIYLYGSFGTPYQRVESDLDLAILSAQKQDPLVLWRLAEGQ